jgi:hypothetical protein
MTITLQLELPKRDDSARHRQDLTPRGLESWINSQPLFSTPAAWQQLLELLGGLNQSHIDPDTRFIALEQLRPYARKVAGAIRRTYLEAAFPLSEKHYGHALLVQRLYGGMADGYKLVVTDQLLGDTGIGNLEALLHDQIDMQLLKAIYHVMVFLSDQLVEAYMIYAEEPRYAWRDLHRLYLFAEQHLLHVLSVQENLSQQQFFASINGVYKQIVLLALCNPNHLMQGEVEQLYHHMAGWSRLVRIVPAHESSELIGRFSIDPDADSAPFYSPQSNPRRVSSLARVIDLANLLDLLDAHIRSLRDKVDVRLTKKQPTLQSRMEISMYQRLKRSLEMRDDRHAPRVAQPGEVEMATGLAACHHFVSMDAPARQSNATDEAHAPDPLATLGLSNLTLLPEDARPWAETPAANTAAPHSAQARTQHDDIWMKVYASDATRREISSMPGDTRAHHANPWHTRDSSAEGLSLYCINDCRARVRVGELLAYRSLTGDARSPYRIGVIRWLHAADHTGVNLGVMTIADDATPLVAQALDGVGVGSQPAHALLIPRGDPRGENTTLITPTGLYDVGTLLGLNSSGKTLYVRLSELIESTRSYARYRYTFHSEGDRTHDSGHNSRLERRIR